MIPGNISSGISATTMVVSLPVFAKVFVPRGAPHGFVCIGPECGRLIIVSSPGGLCDAFIR
jgi:hypothetical protein